MADLPWALDTEPGKAGAGEGENQLAEEEEKEEGDNETAHSRRAGKQLLWFPMAFQLPLL